MPGSSQVRRTRYGRCHPGAVPRRRLRLRGEHLDQAHAQRPLDLRPRALDGPRIPLVAQHVVAGHRVLELGRPQLDVHAGERPWPLLQQREPAIVVGDRAVVPGRVAGDDAGITDLRGGRARQVEPEGPRDRRAVDADLGGHVAAPEFDHLARAARQREPDRPDPAEEVEDALVPAQLRVLDGHAVQALAHHGVGLEERVRRDAQAQPPELLLDVGAAPHDLGLA